MGVPVVTLTGDALHQNASASLLAHCGYPEWIAKNIPDYIQITTMLAQNGSLRKKLRLNLKGEISQSPIHDTKSFAKNFFSTLKSTLS